MGLWEEVTVGRLLGSLVAPPQLTPLPLFSPSLTRKNSRLQFNKVKVEDAGEYVCEAENILGKDTVRGRLHVNSGRWPLEEEKGP